MDFIMRNQEQITARIDIFHELTVVIDDHYQFEYSKF